MRMMVCTTSIAVGETFGFNHRRSGSIIKDVWGEEPKSVDTKKMSPIQRRTGSQIFSARSMMNDAQSGGV